MCVLIVEDEWLILQSVYDCITDAGYDAMTAMSGPEALSIMASHPNHFSCLVTDYTMPGGMTGADLVERMRPSYPDIPIILATALPGRASDAWRLQHDMALLLKPYRSRVMLQLVTAGLAAKP